MSLTNLILFTLASLPVIAVLGYVALSAWFDARYPTAAEEIAREDVEHLLQSINAELTSRPRLSFSTTI